MHTDHPVSLPLLWISLLSRFYTYRTDACTGLRAWIVDLLSFSFPFALIGAPLTRTVAITRYCYARISPHLWFRMPAATFRLRLPVTHLHTELINFFYTLGVHVPFRSAGVLLFRTLFTPVVG